MYPSIEENFLFKEVLSPMAFLNETGLKTFLTNCDNRYLKKNGGGQLTNGRILGLSWGASWVAIRNNCTVYRDATKTNGAYSDAVYPMCGAKSSTGSWCITTYPKQGDNLIFAFNTDEDVAASVNTHLATYTLTKDGNFSGKAANVTGTVALANGGTGATNRDGARKNIGIQASTSAAPGSGYDPYTIWVQF